ncbi:sphingomyelin phosphodiesterase 5 isoform X1 [Rhincodon typus]|uniref:sphingomyelin phosphodiesterase 5 isoform X1 n=1 Tax=Rhincodon typus TaxID=259920 RepID=UPI0009A2A610|nr:sphingomyelin phosphodiesterase 5 isoform X1 [Rhincodon typus]XP_048474340.1 sphingomyelin phosphodiesterase 5 isoform X1 [Rhincodon typus]XP_048474346.1 sphingomyelin phosphodiesterase 5 isoform X1 [Rhincodon typus]XP_048474351.1 sphingomyelin phosphodiesterase 5 isoform X1 [Rhincodon typus]
MVLRESPFPNACVHGLHTAAWGLIFPCFWSLDHMVASFKPTTYEQQQKQEQECYVWPLEVFFRFLMYVTLLVISVPLALIGFIIWAPLQIVRRPFNYSCVKTAKVYIQEEWMGYGEGKGFSFVEANLCFLPNCLARFNNLSQTQRRAVQIASHISDSVNRPRIKVCVDSPTSVTASFQNSPLTAVKQVSCSATGTQGPRGSVLAVNNLHHIDSSEESSEVDNVHECLDAHQSNKDPLDLTVMEGSNLSSALDEMPPNQPSKQQALSFNSLKSQGKPQKKRNVEDDLPAEISPLFPADVAFVCLLEVFEKRAAAKLKQLLQPAFGHILHDVGVYGFQGCCEFKFFNSGIFLASRYPILDAKFHCFPKIRGEDGLAAKGLLCVKIQVGLTQKGQQIVGYLSCTHLHAIAEDSHIRQSQLSHMIVWINEFQNTSRNEEEKVVFDVLCGDFNFDNCSLEDQLEQQHQILQIYKDPCCFGPGKEKPGVIGTLLQQRTIHEDSVKSPENLQRALEIEELRKQYLEFPINPAVNTTGSTEPRSVGGGRRIDYLLYREDTVAKEVITELEEFTFITQLAGLTDHLPIGMRLFISMVPEEDDASHGVDDGL